MPTSIGQPEPLAELEVHPGHLDRVQRLAVGDLDDAEQLVGRVQHRHPGGEVLGHLPALDEQRVRRASNASSSRPVSSVGSSAITAGTRSRKNSTVAWLSSGGRRLVTSQRDARSTRVRISMRIRVCTAASSLLSYDAISSRNGSEPKISRATKLARVSSAGPAPVSPCRRGQKVMPAPFTRSLTTWVTMISRRSGCAATWSAKPSRISRGKYAVRSTWQ